MNLLHMKYAVEIARTNSLNKAAETLYVGQSALSRAIKELETSLGVTLFERSSKGMTLTHDGEIFVYYAKSVLAQVDNIESMFSEGKTDKQRFSASVPRASYVADAFAKFTRLLGKNRDAEIYYRETNSMTAVKNVLSDSSKLGIIRYAQSFDKYYKGMMEEKGLAYELICEFNYKVLISRESPLARLDGITTDDLHRHTEIAHADPYVPSIPLSEVKQEELPEVFGKRIFVYERASQFELLCQNPDTFMWVSPVPRRLLDRYGLVTVECVDNRRIYKDLLIRREDYKLSELDKLFVEQLIKSKREIFSAEDK